MGEIREEAISSAVGMRTARWAQSPHRQRCRWQREKGEKPKRHLVVLPAPLALWGTAGEPPPPAGTSPPVPANSPSSFE